MKEAIQSIVDFLNSEYNIGINSAYVILIFSFIILLAGIIAGCYKFFVWFRKLMISRATTKQIPYFTNLEIYNALRYYIPTSCQNIAPGNSEEPSNSFAFSTKERLIPFFLNKVFLNEKNDFKYYIILAESGMGKTTFLINLYVRYRNSIWYNFKHTLKAKHNILFVPLADNESLSKINSIPDTEKHNTILLLDAFDEDAKANKDYKSRLDEILQATKKFKYIIITCRTQFFPSEEEEPYITGDIKIGGEKGIHVFKKMYLSPFDEEDIKNYINKKYHFLSFFIKNKAAKLIEKSPNLLVRPMLLNYLDDLIKSNREYKYTYQIYEHLIDKWLDRESKNKSNADNHKKNLFDFSLVIALHIYNNRLKGISNIIEKQDVEAYAETKSIELDKMEMTSRSLLNRNAAGQYKFAHKSIYEYFLALYLFNTPTYIKEVSFDGFDNFRLFISQMSYDHLLKQKISGALIITGHNESSHIDLSMLDYKMIPVFTAYKLEYFNSNISQTEQILLHLIFYNSILFSSNFEETIKEVFIHLIDAFNLKFASETINIENEISFYLDPKITTISKIDRVKYLINKILHNNNTIKEIKNKNERLIEITTEVSKVIIKTAITEIYKTGASKNILDTHDITFYDYLYMIEYRNALLN